MKQLPKNAITFDNTDEVFCVHGRCSEKTLGPLKSGIPNLVRIRTKVLKWSGIGPELGTLVWIFLDGFVMTEKTGSFCFRNFAIQFFVMDGEENMDSNSWMCPSGFPYLSPLELYSCQCGPAAVLLVTQTMP